MMEHVAAKYYIYVEKKRNENLKIFLRGKILFALYSNMVNLYTCPWKQWT